MNSNLNLLLSIALVKVSLGSLLVRESEPIKEYSYLQES